MKNKKIIILPVIAILVIIVGGVSLFAYSNANKKEEKELTLGELLKKYKAKGYVPHFINIQGNNVAKDLKSEDRVDIYFSCDSFSDKMKNEPLANNLICYPVYENGIIDIFAPQYVYEYVKNPEYLDDEFYKKENCKFTVKKSKSKKDDEIKLNKEIKKWFDERIVSGLDVE